MSYQVYQLSELQSMLSDKWEGSPFWTTTEATSAINEALLMWNSLTGFWKTPITITTTPTNFEYALPASIVFGLRVMFNNKPLSPSSLADMEGGRPGWQAQLTTAGGNVPSEPQLWLPISIDMIAIWPQDAVGGNTLTIDGVSSTPRLVNSTDYIDIGAEALNAILGYALHAASFKEGGERFQATMGYFNDFLKEAAEENSQLYASQMFRHFIGLDTRPLMLPTRAVQNDYHQLGGQ